jgi:hypothetical protein
MDYLEFDMKSMPQYKQPLMKNKLSHWPFPRIGFLVIRPMRIAAA